MTGTITTINPKGFGFIKSPEVANAKNEAFFHMNALVGVRIEELEEGNTVSFEIEETPKGLSAVNVQRA